MIIGGSGSIILLITSLLLTELTGLHYLLSFFIGANLAIANNYIWNSRWTFQDKKSSFKGYLEYLLASYITLIPGLVLNYFLTDKYFFYIISSMFTIIAMFLLNYIISKFFIWGESISEASQ